MASGKTIPDFKVGDIVKIPYSGFTRGKIVELRGPLAPGRVQVYRVIVRRKPKPMYIELREDQIEHLPVST